MTPYSISLENLDSIAYYSVHWSPFIRLSRERVGRTIPSEAGIFQIFSVKGNTLDLQGTYQAYYGGLRSTFLEILDEDCPVSFPNKEELRQEESYIRFSLSSSRDVLQDILHHFTGSDSSERFGEIFVEERDTMKVAR